MKNLFKLCILSLLFIFQLVNASVVTTRKLSEQMHILNEINIYRVNYGLSRLKLDDFISKVAEGHSMEMAEKLVPFSHDKFRQRSKQITGACNVYAIAENVAFTDSGLNTIVPLWLHSSGHLKNIEGNFDKTGIGIARDAHGRIYVTQIFVKLF